MRIACVTTTINVPTVLALYAKYGPDVHFIVIGDRKTDDEAVVDFLVKHVPNHAYYGIDWQYKLGYRCARLIPENCIQRRSIGFLEALKWGADVIVSIDDDNSCLDSDYFDAMTKYFDRGQVVLDPAHGLARVERVEKFFNGLQASALSGWFDVGALLQPKAPHRGFPHTKRAEPIFSPVTDAKIGVAAGICLGDPDIGAVERIANGPIVHNVSEVLRSGVVVDPRETWTVFNSQNTAFIRELTPAMFMLPFVGRHDDIYASLICQRVMRERGLHVHFGRPFVWQQRNQHDLVKDLRAEIEGMEKILFFADMLDTFTFSPGSILEQTRFIFERFEGPFGKAALAWCEDCEKVM